MIKFFHKLFNPHCPDCMEAARESKVCDSCEYLKMEVARLHRDNENLLDRLLNKPTKTETKIVEPTAQLRPINKGLTQSWNVRRQLLENEDRQTAKLREENKKSTSELENAVLKDATEIRQ